MKRPMTKTAVAPTKTATMIQAAIGIRGSLSRAEDL